jgi:hypothetical protein
MKRIAKTGLLTLIAVAQVLTIVSVHAGRRQMADAIYRYQDEIQDLYREQNILIDYGITPNPFNLPYALALLSLVLTAVLLIDQVHFRSGDNAIPASTESKCPESSSA